MPVLPKKNLGKNFKGILARKSTSVQKAQGTGLLCRSLLKYTTLVDKVPMRP